MCARSRSRCRGLWSNLILDAGEKIRVMGRIEGVEEVSQGVLAIREETKRCCIYKYM